MNIWTLLIFSNSLTKISPLKFKFRKKGKLIDIISFEIKRLFQNILIGARTSLDPKMQKKNVLYNLAPRNWLRRNSYIR